MSDQTFRIWFCRELHLAYPDGDTSPGARVGLQRFCTKEDHPTWIGCGWLQVVPLPLDLEPLYEAAGRAIPFAWEPAKDRDTHAFVVRSAVDAALDALGVTE
jgi:hypothetical protein